MDREILASNAPRRWYGRSATGIDVLGIGILGVMLLLGGPLEQQHQSPPEGPVTHMAHELWHNIVPALGGAIGLGIAGWMFHRKRNK